MVQVTAAVCKGGEEEAGCWGSGFVFADKGTDGADEVREHLFGFSEAFFVGGFGWDIVVIMENIDRIRGGDPDVFHDDIIKSIHQGIVFEFTVSERHQKLPHTSGFLIFRLDLVFFQFCVCLCKWNRFGDCEIFCFF